MTKTIIITRKVHTIKSYCCNALKEQIEIMKGIVFNSFYGSIYIANEGLSRKIDFCPFCGKEIETENEN